jgi:hypothetical protein
MAQDVSSLQDVMQEVFTASRLEKQFYDEFRLFDKLHRTSKWTHGKKAVVPVHAGRSGGVTTLSSAGGTLNAADKQRVDRAEYLVPYHYHQIELQLAAINEATGGGFSIGSSVNLEVEGGLSDLRNNITRQFLGDNTGLIARMDATTNNTTLEMTASGYGYDAIVRGWLYPGLLVDIGTTADPDSEVDGLALTGVRESSTDPDVILAAADTVADGSFISVAQATQNGGNTSNESDGLRNMAASTTAPSGTLDPDTAGQEFWQPAHVDTTTTVLSLNLLLTLQRKVNQKVGSRSGTLVMGLYQKQNFYELLQNQVRFSSDSVKAGNDQTETWNGGPIVDLPEVPDREVYYLTLSDLALVTGAKIKKPTWVSSLQGANQAMLWAQGSTRFVDALTYPVGLAMSRRNSHAAAIGLTA